MATYLSLESNMEGGNMRCQIPGCKNKGVRATTKDGIFCGVHLENIMVYTCGRHSKVEIETALERIGEDEASNLQQVNPFTGQKMFNETA